MPGIIFYSILCKNICKNVCPLILSHIYIYIYLRVFIINIYFLLPYSALRSDISPLDLASIARKLTSAAGSSPRLPLSLLRLILQARAASFAQALCGALRRRRGGEESGEICGVGEFGYDDGLWLSEIVASFVEAVVNFRDYL
ncbi:unnamed protein product [Malus baccata var. baccata]